jgi:hypothetical protein
MLLLYIVKGGFAMARTRATAPLFALAGSFISSAFAQEATSDAYAARDICVGVAAKFAHAAPGASITYNSGKFKIEGSAGGQVTVFEDSIPIATMQDFNYKDFSECIDKTLKGIQANEKKSEINRKLTIFNAAVELNSVLNVGTCMQSAATAGLYFGDLSQSNRADGKNIVSEDYYVKFLEALDVSLANRLKGAIDDDTRFTLEDDIKFFRYVPGRFVPYFPMDAISKNNSYLSDNLDDEYLSFAELGKDVGTLTRLYGWYSTLLQFLYAGAQYDPRSAPIRASLQCMDTPIRSLTSSINGLVDEIGFSDIDIPKLDDVQRMTPEQLHTSDVLHRLVTSIRSNIRGM